MEVRQCGKSKFKLPALGVGCWSFGGGDYWGAQNQADVNAVVCYAVDHGCNFFDTAEAYNNGESEISLGRALKGIPREKVLVATKLSPSNALPEKIDRHCDASLKRLGLEYVDLYMLHWPVGSSRVDLQACKLEYSIVSPK